MATQELPQQPDGTIPCEWCGEPVTQPDTGRPRRYCRRSHRQRAFEARVLKELRDAAGIRQDSDSSQ